MNMRKEEVVNEIRRMCGQAVRMQSLGWHFRYNGQAYFYVVGKDESMLRFCIPFVTGICSHERPRLKEAVDETNRNVKFVKALDFAVGYLEERTNNAVISTATVSSGSSQRSKNILFGP